LIAGSPRHLRQVTVVPRARAYTLSHGNARSAAISEFASPVLRSVEHAASMSSASARTHRCLVS